MRKRSMHQVVEVSVKDPICVTYEKDMYMICMYMCMYIYIYVYFE